MPGKTVAEKLLIKPGQRVAALHAPSEYGALVGPLPDGAVLVAKPVGAGVVHLFVRTAAELAARLPKVLAAIAPDTLFWVSYPKKTSGVVTDMTRDRGWEPMTGAGWEAVTQVAVDEVWSALRFRPSEAIGDRARARRPTPKEPRGSAPATVKVPADLAAALAEAPAAEARFAKLLPSHRREHVQAIEEAKRPETRARRIAASVKMLLEEG